MYICPVTLAVHVKIETIPVSRIHSGFGAPAAKLFFFFHRSHIKGEFEGRTMSYCYRVSGELFPNHHGQKHEGACLKM